MAVDMCFIHQQPVIVYNYSISSKKSWRQIPDPARWCKMIDFLIRMEDAAHLISRRALVSSIRNRKQHFAGQFDSGNHFSTWNNDACWSCVKILQNVERKPLHQRELCRGVPEQPRPPHLNSSIFSRYTMLEALSFSEPVISDLSLSIRLASVWITNPMDPRKHTV